MTEGSTQAPGAAVRNGIDVLAEDDFRELRDARIAILTNYSGTLLDGSRTIDALFARDEFILEKIFSPEHGLTGNAADGQSVADGIDEATGLAVFSLFGDRDRPTQEQLEGLSALLFDVQDVGCRFYTYETTLGYALEACAEAGVRVYVLDRPNPLNGLEVDGPSSDPACESFVNYHPMPLRHGLTIGELARLFNGEREIGADLRVAMMAGWQRDLWQDQTGQPWADPSPAIRDLTAAALYPAVGLLEGTNISVGRGTPEPFHVIGAPWIDGAALQKKLEQAELPGMRYAATTFEPQAKHHPHFGVRCNGVRLLVEDNGEIAVGALSLALIRALRGAYPGKWEFRKLDRLLARPDLLDAIEDNAAELDELWEPDPDFFDVRAKYLLY
jgi:uncharacterized protein YbbC (DUF1343 family)